MGKFPYIFILIWLLSSPQAVLATEEGSTPLEIISIPSEETIETKLILNQTERVLTKESFTANYSPNKKTRRKLASLNRKFGPLNLGLKVNPFNFNNSGLIVGLDLLRSYEILSTKPSFEELREAFKADPNQYIIDPELRSILGKMLLSINDRLNPFTSSDLKVQ